MKHSPTAKRRVVMLVDNSVDGDSRVQKAARSMAEAGWDVHLIGRAPGAVPDTYMLGRAHVYRLPLQAISPRRSLLDRAMRLRFPLACKSTPAAEILQREITLSKIEEVQRAHAPGTHGGGLLPRPVRDLTGKVRRRYLKERVRQTRVGVKWCKRHEQGRIQRLDTAVRKAVHGTRAWRRLDPTPLRYDITYAALIDELRPDLVHAHDYRMIGVGARAAARARARGERVPLLYDAHEFVPGLIDETAHRWLVSQVLHEREYLQCADAVVTVSEPLAELLVSEHGLAERPAVVLNTPPSPAAAPERTCTDVRDACGLRPEQPLAVYCGGASPQRGLHTLVGTLALLPELHVALLVNKPDSDYVTRLRRTAAEAGAADRLHVMGYVPYDELPEFLSTADVGVHPLIKGPINHEVALSTKFFEFMQARIPVVVSDVKAMSEAVKTTGIGEVFTAEDTGDLAAALKTVLSDPGPYREPYSRPELLDRYTWERQSEVYDEIYRRLLLMPARTSPSPSPTSI
ncbi:glycosyltransferase family 4 protein [Glycomyces tenuis]|uniref:glycosyltransferase family 4 protein n=3 Tax=Glycomyces tenuis TaxID=58116 RepID=UPI000412F7AD|nr:glycosyltransferase family 4 protein [Glycomyces tenuis]